MPKTTKRLIVVVGPTAVGKTAVGINLAQKLGTEIISADSRQLFKEMNIGTAKPDAAELKTAKHHFINYKSIEEDYDAGQFERDVIKLLEDLFDKYDDVILCGGSGMYVRAVCEGFDEMPEVAADIRKQVIADYEAHGLAWLQQEVSDADPGYFEVVDNKNPQRLMRALEIVRATGHPASKFRQQKVKSRSFSITKIGLELDRHELYERIDSRVDEMIAHGLEAEAKNLFAKRHLNALQTVGYQEIFGFFEGQYDWEEAVRLLKRNTRRYAKRQLTWFKKDTSIRWFHPKQLEEILDYIDAK